MQSQAELIYEKLEDPQSQNIGSVVAVYDSHEVAEKVVLEIQNSRF